MNREYVKRALLRHAGLLTGGLLGILSGLHIFGLAIGTLVGYFVDEIMLDRRVLKNGAGLIKYPERGIVDDRWTGLISGAAVAYSIRAKESRQPTEEGTIGAIEREMFVGRIAESFELVGREAGLLKQIIIRSWPEKPVAAERFAALYKSVSTPEQCRNLVQVLLLTCPEQKGDIKGISEVLEISPDLYNEMRIDTVGVDVDAYEILGVDPRVKDSEIRRIYRQLAAQFHPDTGGGLEAHQRAQSREAFIKIQNAYNRICRERSGLSGDHSGGTPKENCRPENGSVNR